MRRKEIAHLEQINRLISSKRKYHYQLQFYIIYGFHPKFHSYISICILFIIDRGPSDEERRLGEELEQTRRENQRVLERISMS